MQTNGIKEVIKRDVLIEMSSSKMDLDTTPDEKTVSENSRKMEALFLSLVLCMNPSSKMEKSSAKLNFFFL